MPEKTIKDLDIDKIEERHLIILEKDFTFYRRTSKNPLEFQYSGSTFTTVVPLEIQGFYITHQPSAGYFGANKIHTVFKETENYTGNVKVYQITVRHRIERILDLNQLCSEQEIEPEYLRPDKYFKTKEEQIDFEKELHKLYVQKLKNKRLHGIKFRSRKDPEGDCIVFYDNLPHLSIMRNWLINNTEKSLVKILNLTKKITFINKKLQKLFSKLMFSLNGYTVSEYVSCQDITDDIVKFDGRNKELLEKIKKPQILF